MARWSEFERRYARELDGKGELVDELIELSRKSDLTLLYGAKDEERNQAVSIAAYLRRRIESTAK